MNFPKINSSDFYYFCIAIGRLLKIFSSFLYLRQKRNQTEETKFSRFGKWLRNFLTAIYFFAFCALLFSPFISYLSLPYNRLFVIRRNSNYFYGHNERRIVWMKENRENINRCTKERESISDHFKKLDFKDFNVFFAKFIREREKTALMEIISDELIEKHIFFRHHKLYYTDFTSYRSNPKKFKNEEKLRMLKALVDKGDISRKNAEDAAWSLFCYASQRSPNSELLFNEIQWKIFEERKLKAARTITDIIMLRKKGLILGLGL